MLFRQIIIDESSILCSRKVKKVYTHKERSESSPRTGKLRSKVLRLFGANIEFQATSITHKITPQEDSYHVSADAIRHALLDAELKGAMALMEWQRRQRLY